MKLTRWVFMLLLLATTASAGFAGGSLFSRKPELQRLDPAKQIVLENAHVRFAFEGGGMGLAAMTDRASGVNHIQTVSGPHLLWKAVFGKSPQQTPTLTNNSKPCDEATLETLPDGGQRLVLAWNHLRHWLEDNAVTVKVMVELPADSGIARWHIDVENRSDYWGLWSVSFPLVNGFAAKGQYDIARPTFASGGLLLKQCRFAVGGRYPSGGWPMQFTSLARGGRAVYFGTQDPDGWAKDFSVEPGVNLSLIQYPENMGVAGSDLPDVYPIELGVHAGNWVEAARHYRSWALQQKWMRKGRLSQRSDVPESIKNVALWMTEGWNWHPKPGQKPGGQGYITASGALEDPTTINAPFLAAQKTMDVPMGLHWYHWHHNKFNHDLPRFLPARPGFKERVAELERAGWLVMPYINGSSADMDLPDFARFAPHASLDSGGGYFMTIYGDVAGRILSMCPTDFWQDAIAGLVDDLARTYGVNAIYLDQVSAMGHDLCFNTAHGHPRGGGHYWADGYRELLHKVQNVTLQGGRQIATMSEGADELFLDVLSTNLTWAQPSEMEIPMMQVVYSGYTLFSGSPCDYTRSNTFFRAAQGRAVMDGRQNGWMDIGLFAPENKAKVDFLRQCAKLRTSAGKFLIYGQLLRPVEPLNQVPTFEDERFGWDKKHLGKMPIAEGRLWRAEDGRLGVALANYGDKAQPFTFRIDPAKDGLEDGELALRTQETARRGEASEQTVTLPPASIRLIEITPEKGL